LATSPKRRGGRPRGAPEAVRVATIGVRVSHAEYAALRAKAELMAMTPAQWLREAALSRRLPSPPVAAINREQYAELARLAANLNQLTRLANEGERVSVAAGLLSKLRSEVGRLRLENATKDLNAATAQAQQAAAGLNRAANRLNWAHYFLAMAIGLSTAGLVSAFWLWLRPPTIENLLDPKMVAEHLKPAVIEALKPSKGK
jgi:hypothetical protein